MKRLLVPFLCALATPLWAAAPAPLTQQQKIDQVLNRLTFGPRPRDYAHVRKIGIRKYIEEQLHPEKIDDSGCEGMLKAYPDLALSSWRLFQKYPPANWVMAGGTLEKRDKPNEAEKKAANQKVRTILQEMDGAKLTRILYSRRQLEEVMTDFWFNHFNVSFEKARVKWFLPSYERDVIRPRALGNFRDLLGAVAHSPAMLEYLDNVLSTVDPRYVPEGEMMEYPQMVRQMNAPGGAKKRTGLNENYARELMELHTMGVDSGYTQQDVIQVARVLTGWGFDGPNVLDRDPGAAVFTFRFHDRAHDRGAKTVLGREIGESGEKEGEELLDLLCRQPATAHFIAVKLCRRFVSDDPPESLVKKVVAAYFKSDGDIRECLRAIFYSKEFMGPQAYHAKIKTPLEFVSSALRVTDTDLTDPQKAVQFLNLMGEPLYTCEPPTGYPDTAVAWVNSSALLDRMNFGLLLLNNRPNSPGEVDLVKLDPALTSGEDGSRILKGFYRAFLFNQVSAQTRKVLEGKLGDPEVSHAILDDRRKDFEAAQLGALVLGSPDFQRK